MNNIRKIVFWVVLSTSRPVALAVMNLNPRPLISVIYADSNVSNRKRHLQRRYGDYSSFTIYN